MKEAVAAEQVAPAAVALILLWLAFVSYASIVHAAFLGTFAITVAIFAAAIAVRDTDENKRPRATGDQ